MGKIIAIGGGEIGRPGCRVETAGIDKEIIRQTGKKHPVLLFIPTASLDSPVYVRTVKKHFGQTLGCKVATLLLTANPPSYQEIQKKILDTDMVYVGGGNTPYMLKAWRKLKVDRILLQAYKRNKVVLSGLSAGAICWFRSGLSDLGNFEKHQSKTRYRIIKALGMINATVSPHHIREPQRENFLARLTKAGHTTSLALDDYAAIEILDDKYRILTSKPFAKVHKLFWKGDKLIKRQIFPTKAFRPISGLL